MGPWVADGTRIRTTSGHNRGLYPVKLQSPAILLRLELKLSHPEYEVLPITLQDNVSVLGLEPRKGAPKTPVLPLHHTEITSTHEKIRTSTLGFGDQCATITTTRVYCRGSQFRAGLLCSSGTRFHQISLTSI